MNATDRNRLSESTSPYLLQHKDNPVHWQPWDHDALEAARRLDRPILLSIGYAACHWCHVMAHESFEDESIAALMNRLYVNIKVDREERPDIDQIYMAALSAMGEQGGWPLTMILTPDGDPFWGGTYFPKEPRYGRPGFGDVLVQVEAAWRRQPTEIRANADRLKTHLRDTLAGRTEPAAVDPSLLSGFAANIAGIYDAETGGIRGAPKFPNAPFMETLWRSSLRDRNKAARDRFVETVTAIALGGIYDHVGGGIARYTVDGQWLVPHFEKMLYDNGHFIRHCIWAHAATGNDLFRIRIEETATWLQRDMLMPSGGLAASLDADSEGEEGKYYVWTASDLDHLLDADSAADFSDTYDVTVSGNWEGKTILNLSAWRDRADTVAAIVQRHRPMLDTLLAARSLRVPPGRDTKILADWNGYAIRAIAEAGRYFGSESWIVFADELFDAIIRTHYGQDRLAHVHDGVKPSPFGFATDYASMINAALSLQEATGNARRLETARDLAAALRRNHYDHESNLGYWMSEHDREDTPLLAWNDLDEANPSATAQTIEALARLALATDDAALTAHVDSVLKSAAGRILKSRFGQGGFINAADTVIAARKLVVVGPDRASNALWRFAAENPDPRRSDIFLPSGAARDQYPEDGAYLCAGMACSAPVTTASELARLLEQGI